MPQCVSPISAFISSALSQRDLPIVMKLPPHLELPLNGLLLGQITEGHMAL